MLKSTKAIGVAVMRLDVIVTARAQDRSQSRWLEPFEATGFTFEVSFAYDADRPPAR